MGDIYENGYVTIAAASSNGGSCGMLSDPNSPLHARKLQASQLCVVEVPSLDIGEMMGLLRSNHGGWPLLKRAWVYQERQLSRRVVHFTDSQLFWECHSAYKSESGCINQDWSDPAYINREVDYGRVPFKYPMADSIRAWQQVVEDYSALGLTHYKDRLLAVAAVVLRLMKNRVNDEYIAGMWRSSLLSDLT